MHDALLCIGTGSLVADPNRFRFHSDQHYLKSAAEMRYLFRELPEACNNTLLIAERASVTIEFDNDALPSSRFRTPFARHTQEGANRLLRDLVLRGAHERYGESLSDEVMARLENELVSSRTWVSRTTSSWCGT